MFIKYNIQIDDVEALMQAVHETPNEMVNK